MRVNMFLGGLAALTAASETEDPWQCVTENITQYFDVPTLTGTLFDALNSYADGVAAPCRATATGRDKLSCTVSDPKSWCGFTTAAPADVLSGYSTYLSDVVSFWTAKSETISVLSTSCPVAWKRFAPIEHEWLKIATAHANCYLEAHSQTQTDTTAPTSTAGDATTLDATTLTTGTTETTATTSEASVSRRGQALEVLAFVSTGFAILANAA